jgi:hypothetical protein
VLLDVGGQDATEAFEDVGHSDEAREILKDLLVGKLKRVVCPPLRICTPAISLGINLHEKLTCARTATPPPKPPRQPTHPPRPAAKQAWALVSMPLSFWEVWLRSVLISICRASRRRYRWVGYFSFALEHDTSFGIIDDLTLEVDYDDWSFSTAY